MMTGWVLVGSKYYYFDANGKMVTDTWIGKRYLKSNGQMAKSCWVGAYYINKKETVPERHVLPESGHRKAKPTSWIPITRSKKPVGRFCKWQILLYR